MSTQRIKTALPLVVFAALMTLTLSACGGDEAPADTDDEVVTDITAPAAGDDTGSDDETDAEVGALFPGTGEYEIGVDIPFGGFQLLGEPAGQPDGCAWSIVDEDGAVAFENQGVYVFLTDIPEAVTFITTDCPEWEQFE